MKTVSGLFGLSMLLNAESIEDYQKLVDKIESLEERQIASSNS